MGETKAVVGQPPVHSQCLYLKMISDTYLMNSIANFWQFSAYTKYVGLRLTQLEMKFSISSSDFGDAHKLRD